MRRPLSVISLIFLGFGFAPTAPSGQGIAGEALHLAAERSQALDEAPYLAWLDETAREIGRRTSHLRPDRRIEAINRYLFQEIGFRVRGKLESPDSLFLDRVIDKKAGYCAGLATVYLALGERLHWPLFAVAAPGHVFVRYDDGTFRRNIELTEGGRELSDEEYVRRFRIPRESLDQGVFLRNLSPGEFIAQILNNRAVLAGQSRDFVAAEEDYRRALELDPLLQAVYYNRGNDRVLQGKLRKARRDLTRAVALNPNDHEAWNNRGVCLLKLGKEDKAGRDFRKALELNPGFRRAVENLKRLERVKSPTVD